jgi:hypothetical protein
MQTQPLEVIDFSLGITDYFIDGDPRQAEVMDNLLINPNGKPFTRPGSELLIESQMPLGSFRVNGLFIYEEEELLAFQQKRGYYNNAGSWTEIQGPTGGTFFPDGDANSLISSGLWQNHLFMANSDYSSVQKVYRQGGVFYVRNAGLPDIPSGITITPSTPGSNHSYLYAFVFRYSYQSEGLTYLDRGPVYTYETAVTTAQPIDADPNHDVDILNIPTNLTTVENWDEANIEIEIYRTADAGTVYYLVDTISLGTTSYLDTTEDVDLQLNEEIYTTGGALDNDPPPQCKYVHVVNNIGYYANILEDLEIKNRVVYQSKPGDIDSVPRSFFAEAEQDIHGISSIFDRPMVFCYEYIYRIDNFINFDGTGSMLLRRIDDRAGCVSDKSIVQTTKGIFWAGREGFYWSDGFKVQQISLNLNESYKSFIENETKQTRIEGTYDPGNDRIYWSVSVEDGSNEPDRWYILDLKPGIREESSFTTASGGDSFRPTAITHQDGLLYRGDTNGFVFVHDPSIFTDPKVDVGVDPSLWYTQVIEHTYKSCFLDFGSKFYRKFVPRVLISCANNTNLSLAISSSNDNNRVTGDLKPIRYRNSTTWGDALPLWADADAEWNVQGLIEEWRRFPAKGLRCNYKQLILTNDTESKIVDSTLLGTATVNSGTTTATLGGSFEWVPDIVDYFIYFEHDNYATGFEITAQTTTTLTYSTLGGGTPPPDGVFNWVIKGKPKGEVLELNGYVLHWAYISKSHTPFSASSLGSNPT